MTTIFIKNGTPTESQSKCETCAYAHIMRGFRESEEVAYCTVPYGPPLRVPFKVHECSSYRDRNHPSWKQMEDLAIDIQPLTSAKPAGFRLTADHDSGDSEAELQPPRAND